MKPEQLKSPFSWKERRVLFQDRVLYVPNFLETYDDFIFPGFQDLAWFGNNHPVNVEFCSGNGAWITEKAQKFPNENWVAVEMQFERARKIWAKIKNLSLSNLIVICGDGRLVASQYFQSESIDHVFVNFPDPWPKKKHVKHRILQPSFVEEIARILTPPGKVTLATDDPDTSSHMIHEMLKNPHFTSIYPEPFYVHELEGYGSSFFEDLFRKQGKQIFYHCLKK